MLGLHAPPGPKMHLFISEQRPVHPHKHRQDKDPTELSTGRAPRAMEQSVSHKIKSH